MSLEFSSGLFELSFDPKQFSLLSNSLQTTDNLNFSDFDPSKKDPPLTLDLSSILYLKEKITNLEKKFDSQNNTITDINDDNRMLHEKAAFGPENETAAQTSSEKYDKKDNLNEKCPNSLEHYEPHKLPTNKNLERPKPKSSFSQLRNSDKKPQPSLSNPKAKLSSSFTNFPSIDPESLNLSCNSNKENLSHPNNSIRQSQLHHFKAKDGRVSFSQANNSIRKSKHLLPTQPLRSNLSYSQNEESFELSKEEKENSSQTNNSIRKNTLKPSQPPPSSNLSYSQNEESFELAKDEASNSIKSNKPRIFKSTQPHNSSNLSYSQNEESFELERNEKTLFSRIKADALQKLRKRVSYPRKHEYIEIGPKERESIKKPKRESSLISQKNNKNDDLEDWFKTTQTSVDVQKNKTIIKGIAEKVLEPHIYRQKVSILEEFGNIGEEMEKNGKIWACFGDELERERRKNEELSRIVEEQHIMIKEYEKLTKQSNFIRQQCHEMNFGLSDVIRKLILINNDSKKIIDFCQNNEKERNYLSFSQQMEVILEEMKFYWTKWIEMHETFKISQSNIYNLGEEEEQHQSPKENIKRLVEEEEQHQSPKENIKGLEEEEEQHQSPKENIKKLEWEEEQHHSPKENIKRGGYKDKKNNRNEENKLVSQRMYYNEKVRYKTNDKDEKVFPIENFEGQAIAQIFDNLKKLHRQSKAKIHKKYQN